jgi:hypothetical protein
MHISVSLSDLDASQTNGWMKQVITTTSLSSRGTNNKGLLPVLVAAMARMREASNGGA